MIKPDNIIDLVGILDLSNPAEKEDYDTIKKLVQMNLFSRYDNRRAYAGRELKEFFNPWTKVYTLESDGILYAYLSLTKNRDIFFYIGKYDSSRPVLEEIPSEEERKLW